MKRLAFLLVALAGCTTHNNATDGTWFAINPQSGVCTPLPASVDHGSLAGWQSCSDPCAGLDVRSCKADARCQAVDDSAGYRACRAVPSPFDPCAAIDPTKCNDDPRCALAPTGGGCDCAAGVVCNCPAAPPAACALKPCSEVDDAAACNARPDCTTTPPRFVDPPSATAGSGGVSSGSTQPKSTPTVQCFPFGGCNGANESDCKKSHECVPTYDGQNHFGSCGTIGDCHSTAECATGERCNANHACVVEGCAGDSEVECNADPHCEPIYSLNCSPYANGGGGGVNDGPGVFCGPTGGGGGAPLPQEAPAPGSCTCEPTFSSCQAQSGGCDPGKSVLVRDPTILDDPYWSLSHVLGLVSGADPSAVADAWLAQLGTTATVGGKTVNARTGAAQFFAQQPHRADGLLDATKLGFQPTALSNRMDLADTTSCGEARITYAALAGSSDRRHRMTIIVELRQPYDGNRCRTTAQAWLALGKLDGAALQSALQALYAPLLAPANLKQVRTNEFLVGPQDPTQPNAAWELREFHLGADARLHQVLLPLQVDPAAVANSADFLAWAQSARDGLARGTLTFPAQYQVPAGSEDGARVTLSDGVVADVVNHSTCAGCHTTATNSAFAHVAERFAGTGRAEISQFLEGELQKRAAHLVAVAAGVTGAALEFRPLH